MKPLPSAWKSVVSTLALGLLAFSLLLPDFGAAATAPNSIHYQGRLRDKTTGELMTQSGVTVRFDVYNKLTAPNAQSTTYSATVDVVNGLFDVEVPINPAQVDFDRGPYYMRVFIQGEDLGEEPIFGVPYALNADQLDGYHADELMGFYITNQFAGAQNPGNFWIAGQGRIGQNLRVDGNLDVGGNITDPNDNTVDVGENLFVNGNLGVRTASPSEALQVVGNALVSGNITGNLVYGQNGLIARQSGGNGFRLMPLNSTDSYLRVRDEGNTTYRSLLASTLYATSNVQVDGAIYDPGDTDVNIGENLTVAGQVTATRLVDSGNASYFWDGDNTSISMTVAGRVGIGETAPTNALDVNGSARVYSTLLVNSVITDGGNLDLSGGGWGMNYYIDTDANSPDFFRWYSDGVQRMSLEGDNGNLSVTGALAIGGPLSSNAGDTLQITDNLNVTGYGQFGAEGVQFTPVSTPPTTNVQTGRIYYDSDDDVYYYWDGTQWQLMSSLWQDGGNYIYARNATPNIAVTDTGRLGVGMTNPANALHVAGNIGATGWIGAGCEGACEASGGYSLLYANGVIRNTNYTHSTSYIRGDGGFQVDGLGVISSDGRMHYAHSGGTTSSFGQVNTSGWGVNALNDGDWDLLVYENSSYMPQLNLGYVGSALLTSYDTNESLSINTNGTGNILLEEDGTGMVGIGTTAPTQRLDVNGDLRLRKTGTTTRILFDPQANDPGEIRHVENNNAAELWLDPSDDFGAGATNDFVIIGEPNTNTQRFWVRGDGTAYVNNRLGISTTAPTEKLVVDNGNLMLQNIGAVNARGVIFGEGASHTMSLAYDGRLAGNDNKLHIMGGTGVLDSDEVMTVTYGGNVGIGVTNPQTTLQLGGSIRGNQAGALRIDSGNGVLDLGAQNTAWAHISTDRPSFYFSTRMRVNTGQIGSYDEDLSLQTAGTTRVTVQNGTGNVGVGITGPTQRLDVSGNIDVNSGIYYLNDVAGSAYGLGYGVFGGTQATLFSDDIIEFTESDANVVRARWSMNSPLFEFFGDVDLSNNALLDVDWATSDDGPGSQLDADFLDGVDSTGFARAFGTRTFGSSTSTAAFMSELSAIGMLSHPSTTAKGSWSYAGNADISDTGFGAFELAGTALQVWNDGGTRTVLAIRPNTGAGAGQVMVYNDQGSGYSPGWRQIWTDRTDGAGSGLDADVLDGIESNRIVYGDNATKTSDIGNFNVALPSGFYNGYQATGSPTATWYTLINTRHTNTTNNYGSQLAMSFYSRGDIFNRNISNGSYSAWSRIWNDYNDGAGSGLDADLLDGYNSDTWIMNNIPGDWGVVSASNNSSYPYAALEVRELNRAGSQTGADSEAPRISFHWGGRVASQLALQTNGTIAVRNNPGTGYENFAAAGITANGNLSVNNKITTPDSNNPYLVLDSSSSGGNTAEQSAQISLGEAGRGQAALHLAYTGNGYSYLGMGSLGTDNIPDYYAMRFFYTNSNIYMPGWLGIGVGTPSYPLHVSGNGMASGYLRADGGYQVDGLTVISSNGRYHYGHTGGVTSTFGQVNTSGWGVDAASNGDWDLLTYEGTSYMPQLRLGYVGSALLTTYDTNEALSINTSGSGNILLEEDGTGNVGIGTASPGAKLDITSGAGSGLRVINTDNSHTWFNYAGTNNNYLRGATTFVDTTLDMNQHDIIDGNTIYMDNWFRSNGTTGWYSQDYGGGWHMTDTTWIRAYNGKHIYTTGLMRADTNMQSPIFYDYNNTGYYGDFASTSRLNHAYLNYLGVGTGVNTTYRIYATGAAYGIYGLGSTMGGRFEDSNSTARVYLGYDAYDVYANGTGRIDATSQMRAPIFYDYNNTGYYGDFASWSRFNEIGTNRTYAYWDMRSPIYYDYNNTSYYVDPQNTSRMGSILLDSGGAVDSVGRLHVGAQERIYLLPRAGNHVFVSSSWGGSGSIWVDNQVTFQDRMRVFDNNDWGQITNATNNRLFIQNRIGVRGNISIAGDPWGWGGLCADCADAINGNPNIWLIARNNIEVVSVNTGGMFWKTNNADNKMRLQFSNGDLFIDGTYHCNGADIAELIGADSSGYARELEAGDVVIVHPDLDETVGFTDQTYDTRVAGIISSNPGLLLGNQDGADSAELTETVTVNGDVPLALAGRVPVKVSDENGPIRRGDLLVTASTPGYAMKADPALAEQGTIVGKAMGELESGEGTLIALVNLQ